MPDISNARPTRKGWSLTEPTLQDDAGGLREPCDASVAFGASKFCGAEPLMEVPSRLLTIITCYRPLSRTPYFNSDRWNINMFLPFIRSGLPCIIVLDNVVEEIPPELLQPNVQIIRTNVSSQSVDTVPHERNPDKDTAEYIAWTYDKPNLYLHAIQNQNDANKSGHYICLDYDAATWLGGSDALGYLKWMCSHSPEQNTRTLCIPGGWDKYTAETVKSVASKICWRFCNGCIFADRESLKEWCLVYKALIEGFRQVYCGGVLPWDVNYVAWLEYKELGPKITWYSASHNISMLENIPHNVFISRIPQSLIREKTHLDYSQCPSWPKHYPGSVSVAKIGNDWWMMTRYINYWMYPTGYYHFYEPDQKIRTRNLLSRLCPETWKPLPNESWFMDDEVLGCDGLPLLQYENKISFGIEDVRIYSGENGNMCFVGATLGFSPEGNARIVSGEVDIANKRFVDARIHPSDEWCEKNWIPVPGDGKEFIYKWTREGIVLRSSETQNTRLVSVSPEVGSIIHRFRGSSILMPVSSSDNMVVGYKCVVHWSKEGSPRTYYHAIVELTKDLDIIAISPGFMFEGPGVEFCIGYVPGEDKSRPPGRAVFEDRFWVSRFDRDPFMILVKNI